MKTTAAVSPAISIALIYTHIERTTSRRINLTALRRYEQLLRTSTGVWIVTLIFVKDAIRQRYPEKSVKKNVFRTV